MSLHSSKPAANSDLFSSHIWPKQWWQILILVKSVGEDKKKPDIVISCYSHIRPKHWYWNQALVQSVAEIRNTNLQLGVWFSFSVWCRTTSDRKLKSDPECFKIWFCRRFVFFLSHFIVSWKKGGWIDFSFLSWSFAKTYTISHLCFNQASASAKLDQSIDTKLGFAKSVVDIWNMKLQ